MTEIIVFVALKDWTRKERSDGIASTIKLAVEIRVNASVTNDLSLV